MTTEIFKFLLGMESIEGTVAEKRIKELITENNEKSGIYKPRSGKVNCNMHWYSKDEIEFVNKEFRTINFYFGYAQIPGAEKNPMACVEYPDTTEEEKKIFNQYKVDTEQALKWYSSEREAVDKKSISLALNEKDEEVGKLFIYNNYRKNAHRVRLADN